MKNLLVILAFLMGCKAPTEAQQAQQKKDSSYREFPMELHMPDATIYGTLTLPETAARKLTVCLIISGSGPTDRDGNNPAMKNESLKMFAHALADSGIASLRYDKRGVGKSIIPNMKEADLRFENYIHDAEGWIAELKMDTRFNRIVIAGHSEGSLIGMIASAKDVNGFISLAGAGRPAGKLISDQIAVQAPMLTEDTKTIVDSLEAGHTVTKVNPMLAGLFRSSVQPYLISWFQYDPVNEISKLHIPVLIIQGDADLQINTKDANLLTAAAKQGKESIIHKMNHVLKQVDATNADNMASYNDPMRPLNTDLMAPVIKFINTLP